MAEVIRGARLESERLVLAFTGRARAPGGPTEQAGGQGEQPAGQPEKPGVQADASLVAPRKRGPASAVAASGGRGSSARQPAVALSNAPTGVAAGAETPARATPVGVVSGQEPNQDKAPDLAAAEREAQQARRREQLAVERLEAERQAVAGREAERREVERREVLEKARAEGYAAGLAHAQGEHAQAIAALGRLLASAETSLRAGLGDVEDLMVDIAFEAICKLLGESMAQTTGVVAVVRAALVGLPDREPLLLRVSPGDFATLDAHRAQLRPADEGGPIQLISDPRVQHGGCLVELAGGTIDARLETQLQRLVEVLVSTRRLPRDAPA